jgi:hypothetical protein
MTEYIKVDDLAKIFFTKNLVELDKTPPKTPPRGEPSVDSSLTPLSKAIYDTLTPKSKEPMLQLMRMDDLITQEAEMSDPDYVEKFENGRLGFFMEEYISYYGFCPVCGQKSLKKYDHSNVPVVDLVCINRDYHLMSETPFLFQVKISFTNLYFDLNEKIITIGSKTYGYNAHMVKGTSPQLQKFICPGYICIKMNSVNLQDYVVDYRNSFVLLPDYHKQNPTYYYKYLKSDFKNQITWNSSMTSVQPLTKVITENRITYSVFGEEIIKNPYSDLV